MVEAFINSLLYVFALALYWLKYKKVNLYFVLLATYTLIAILGFLYMKYSGQEFPHLSTLNFFYLFIVLLICFAPFKCAHLTKEHLCLREFPAYKWFVVLYLALGILSVIYTLPKAVAVYAIGEWAQVRQDLYNGDDMELYAGQFERLIKNIYNYFSPFGLVLSFYQLTKAKVSYLLTAMLFITWIANIFVISILTASRGMIMTMAISLMIGYVVFQDLIPIVRKITMLCAACAFLLIFGGYTAAISESRFGNDTNDELFRYFGESMLSFNQNIMGAMHDFAYGKYFFKWLFDACGLNSEINFEALGSKHGTTFMTFVGTFYIDWGPILTLVGVVLLSLSLRHFTKKRVYKFADLTVITYFANWFAKGVFVIGYSQSLQWLMLFVVYFIVRTLENYHSSGSHTIGKSQIHCLHTY